MLECHCDGGPKVSPAEHMMAEAEGLDPVEIHKFMDTWERYADKALDLPDSFYDEWYKTA